MSETESDDCGICGLSIDDKFSYTLACNHTFHYECLMKSFHNIPKHKKNLNNHCPYCRKNSDYLPLVNGLKKVLSGVHCDIYPSSYAHKKEELKSNYSNKCEFILTRGKNKGNPCGKNCILGYNTCKVHKNKDKNLIKNTSSTTNNNIQVQINQSENNGLQSSNNV